MLIKTPSGYRHPFEVANGDTVLAHVSGAPIVNRIENIDFVDYKEWCRWWRTHDKVPAFVWYRINDEYELFREQSIWRNGTKVCHARDLKIGDTIYDDEDHSVVIHSIEALPEDRTRVWYRFDIDGDHSYTVDGLTVHNASRFWRGGTGTWDASDTTHWATSSGGAGGASVPGSSDTATFDANSGGGTVTLNFGGTITIQGMTTGLFAGTWDNSVNNNNMTFSAVSAWDNANIGVRTMKLGTATYTLTSTSAQWNWGTTNNLTNTGNTGAFITFSGPANGTTCQFIGNGLSYGNLTLGAVGGSGFYNISGSNTFNSFSITPPNYMVFNGNTTITTAVNWQGTSTNQIGFISSTTQSTRTFALASGSVGQWCAFRDITFTGSPVFTNSFNLRNTSGGTITSPDTSGYPRSGLQAIDRGMSR